mmetsp:Transcript_5304/g.11914  ORF Transcript_5304/g.11914 Transcript_5304/m.11914 type:complete len:362 (+) Transcript_5304:45-1130(+)
MNMCYFSQLVVRECTCCCDSLFSQRTRFFCNFAKFKKTCIHPPSIHPFTASRSTVLDVVNRIRADARHRRLRAIDCHGNAKLLSNFSHQLETLAVVRTAAANIDAHVARPDRILVQTKRVDNTRERGGNVGKVRHASAYEQRTTTGVAALTRTCGHLQKLLRVRERLLSCRRAAVLRIVSKLRCVPQVPDGVRVDHARASSRHHRPDVSVGIQHCQLQAGSRALIHVTNGPFLRAHLRAKWLGEELGTVPIFGVLEQRRVVELATHVKRKRDSIHDRKWIDFHQREVELLKHLERRIEERLDRGSVGVRCMRAKQFVEVIGIDVVNLLRGNQHVCHLIPVFLYVNATARAKAHLDSVAFAA